MDPADLTLVDVLPLLRARSLSARELVADCLARVESHEPRVRAFVVLTPERALAAAAAADESRAAGRPVGPLAGVPVAVKDLLLTAGVPTTASSRVLAGHDPGVDADVWAALVGAGAGLLGKTTTHEFAYGTASHPTANPWDLTRTPAGSSGGSAAALAARMTPLALGTDTGGSLRLPASACGLSSLRPAQGRLSTRGVLPLAPSLDTVGPLARRTRDLALALRLLTGEPYPDAPADLRGVWLGVPAALWEVDEQVAAACRAGLGVLTGLGAQVVEVDAPPSGDAYRTTVLAEARHVHDALLARPDLYGAPTLARLREGEAVTATAYLAAQAARVALERGWRAAAAGVDAVVTPVLDRPVPALQDPPLGPSVSLCVPWSLVGWPSLSVPAGLDGDGLPVGLMLSGPPEREAGLVGLGIALDEVVRLWAGPGPL